MLNRIVTYWRELDRQAVSSLFVKGLYALLLWYVLKSFSIWDILYGPENLSILMNPYEGIDKLAMLFNIESIRVYYMPVLLIFVGLLLFGLFRKTNVVTRLAVWYLFLLLHFANFETSTGGHHLVQQVLFLHIFLLDYSGEGPYTGVKKHIHHLAHYAIWVQIAILYAVSGGFKLLGTDWLQGEAMLMSLSFKEFGFLWLSESLQQNNIFLMSLTWIVLGYQVLFPVLIWVARIRGPFLLVGLIFHLSVLFVVGIVDFGLFMVVSYLIFLSSDSYVFETIDKIRARLPKSYLRR